MRGRCEPGTTLPLRAWRVNAALYALEQSARERAAEIGVDMGAGIDANRLRGDVGLDHGASVQHDGLADDPAAQHAADLDAVANDLALEQAAGQRDDLGRFDPSPETTGDLDAARGAHVAVDFNVRVEVRARDCGALRSIHGTACLAVPACRATESISSPRKSMC